MQGLETGLYAKKYSFWKKEYVTRNSDFIQRCEYYYKEVKKLHEEYGKNSAQSANYISNEGGRLFEGFGYAPRMVDDKLSTDSSVIVKMLVSGEDLVDPYAIFCPGPVRIDREFPGDDLPKLNKGIFPGSEYINLSVDINSNLDSIVEDVKNIVLAARKVSSGEVSSYHSGFYELYRDYRHYASFADRKAFAFGGYTPLSDHVRAVGLWLWDRVKELGDQRGAIKQAIADLHRTDFLPKLGLEDTETADLRFYRRRTDECIEARTVFPFTKSQKGTSK